MLDASKETIPQSKYSQINKVGSKTVPGWNEYVDSYFQTSLLWHSMWIQNGKHRNGVVADILCRSRAQYHCISNIVLKMDAEIRCDKMTEAILINPSGNKLHLQAKIFSHKKATFPKSVDVSIGKDDIANLFKDKFCNLDNSVSYNKNEINVLINDIYKLIASKCNCGGFCIHDTHCNSLSVHLAILFTMMMRHGLSPGGMLFGTMVPITKGRWSNLSNSDNFRAITLSIILCKILDVVILTKESDNLCSSNLQFSFKPGASTSLCTSLVQETISYYVNNGSNVYGHVGC